MTGWAGLTKQLASIDGLAVREMEPMSRHTTLQIGGPADLFVTFDSGDAAVALLRVLEEAGCPWMVAGAGSNLLVMDAGIEGAVITPGAGLAQCSFAVEAPVSVEAGAGMNIGVLLANVSRAGYAGLEFLTGIPGTVGGAVVMNAGTRFGYIDSTLEHVDVASVSGVRRFAADQLHLGYRSSAIPEGSVVVSAAFRLVRAPYAQGDAVATELSELRRKNHPPASGTAGSFFRNPSPERNLFAGQLIEECGLKGFKVGGAVVSERHANFLMNGGGATADDLLSLACQVADVVAREKGVTLVREVKIAGRGSDEWERRLP